MKKIIATLALAALATTAQALSIETAAPPGVVQSITTMAMPVVPGKLQLQAGEEYHSYSKYYDEDGKSNDLNSNESISFATTYVGIAVGIVDGLEVNARIPISSVSYKEESNETDNNGDYIYEDASEFGLSRPNIGVKYGIPDLDLALFLNWSLPFGGKEIVGEDPVSIFSTGVIADMLIGTNLQIRGALAYHIYPEDENKIDRGNVIALDFVPGFKVTQSLTLELPTHFAMGAESAYDGNDVSNTDTQLLSIGPGVRWVINNTVELEADMPLSVMGKNSIGFIGANLEGKFTF